MTVKRFKAAPPEVFLSDIAIIDVVPASDYDALAARCAELEANLLHYGAHMVACDFIQDTLKCSCGFEDIRKRLSPTPSEKP